MKLTQRQIERYERNIRRIRQKIGNDNYSEAQEEKARGTIDVLKRALKQTWHNRHVALMTRCMESCGY